MPAQPGHDQTAREILALQRTVGNAAVTELIRRSQRRPVVQRHSSFEHALLGDTPPDRLVDAVRDRSHQQHLLFAERDRMLYFLTYGNAADPRQRFPQVHWHQLKESKYWVSYGELNALGDYLPDPETIDTMPASQIGKVLTLVRNNIATSDWNAVVPEMKQGGTLASVQEVRAFEKATKKLGVNSYEGLLSRNACHFAPFSWERWAQFHTEARDEALAHFKAKGGGSAASQNVAVDAEEHERQAWLKNGFGDHFLQDSFAAGHLVNKTLVMQWFNEYLGNYVMTVKDQPNIAGQSIYTRGPTSLTHAQNRAATGTITDPQSAQERPSKEARIAGSGVVASGGRSQELNYQAYSGFLDRTHLQLAAGAIHDWFNARGLLVQNGEQSLQFAVGGDDTLLTESGPTGIAVASTAAQSSQRAIRELLSSGTTDVTPERILALVPQWVVPKDEEPISLKDWNEQTLRTLCFKKIFPEIVDKWNSNASLGSFFSPRTTESGSSVDETPQTKALIELTTPHL
jgi:hypothetical protein